MQAPNTPPAARLLVDCLVEQGCDRVFTVPGESFLQVLDGLGQQDAIDMWGHALTFRAASSPAGWVIGR